MEAAVLADCEEFAFVSLSLSLNPGLTHAILISLLRDNHDPEIERERRRSQIHIAFPHRMFFFQCGLWCCDFPSCKLLLFSFWGSFSFS